MTHPDLFAMFTDRDGTGYYARLTVERIGNGFARLTFVGSAGFAEGVTLCRADLDPESVRDLMDALKETP